jgi:hypothetical protein
MHEGLQSGIPGHWPLGVLAFPSRPGVANAGLDPFDD